MRKAREVNLSFSADGVQAAVAAARNADLLCGTCTQKLDTRHEMSQSDFCPACQAAVTTLLTVAVQRRMAQELIRRGLRPDSLEIMSD